MRIAQTKPTRSKALLVSTKEKIQLEANGDRKLERKSDKCEIKEKARENMKTI